MYGKYAPGKWNDNYCDAVHDYVCEKQNGVHNCPDGWLTYGDYCYQLNAHPGQRVTWEQAHTACRDYNKAWEEKIKVSSSTGICISTWIDPEVLKININKARFEIYIIGLPEVLKININKAPFEIYIIGLLV